MCIRDSHCPGCFNAVAWDFGYGQPFDKAVRNEIFASCQPDYIAGISLPVSYTHLDVYKRQHLSCACNIETQY